MSKPLTAKRAAKLLDAQIDAAYNANCKNMTINLMDIPKIFAAGRAAAAAGADVTAAVVAAALASHATTV